MRLRHRHYHFIIQKQNGFLQSNFTMFFYIYISDLWVLVFISNIRWDSVYLNKTESNTEKYILIFTTLKVADIMFEIYLWYRTSLITYPFSMFRISMRYLWFFATKQLKHSQQKHQCLHKSHSNLTKMKKLKMMNAIKIKILI